MSQPPLQTRNEALRFLLEFVDYEKITKYKYDIATFDLRRVYALMESVGDPHRAFPCVHIAGTKGKGSTAVLTQSILTAAGLRTGLFTSPHLTRIEERMTINGEMMAEDEFVEAVSTLVPYTLQTRRERPNESPTFFELVTAAAFTHFARRNVDAAVIEVGMGGRLDATNVVTPEVCAITRVDYDHVERLGATLAKIAGEKAGIIKPGVPVICAPQQEEAFRVIERTGGERNAPLVRVEKDILLSDVRTGLDGEGLPECRFALKTPRSRYPELRLKMLGAHQAINAACAVALAEEFASRRGISVGEDAVRTGLESAVNPARLEFFPGAPAVLLDGAHNPVAIQAVRRTLDETFGGWRVVLLIGVSRDKDAAEMFRRLLSRADAVVFTKSDSPRAAEPVDLAALANEVCGASTESLDNPQRALDRALGLCGPDDLLCITGSFFLAGLLRPRLVSERIAPRDPG
jgi:dihydrofolate synthase/folylpolyglutamate synthase